MNTPATITSGIECIPCLANMSTPPRSVVSYTGLGNLLKVSGGTRVSDRNTYAGIVTFRLSGQQPPVPLEELLTLSGIDPKRHDAEQELIRRIEARAQKLPLPDGAAVTDRTTAGTVCSSDPVAVLAGLTKSSAQVWLRAKTPRLGVLLERVECSLIVPPAFADLLWSGS